MSTETTPTIAARSGPTTGVPERGKTIYTCPCTGSAQDHPAIAKCGMSGTKT